MDDVCKNDRKHAQPFATRSAAASASSVSPDDWRRLMGEFRQQESSSELLLERHTKANSDSDDDVEMDGCVSSKLKKLPTVQTTHDRFAPSMVLTRLPSPVSKGECLMFNHEEGSVDIIEIISGERYLEATANNVDMPTNITGPSEYGKFKRKQGPDGLSVDAPFYLHNVCTTPNFIVMVLGKDNTANLESHTWDEIKQMQSQKQGVHALMSMWNTDRRIKPQITTAIFFNVHQGGQSYNYYLQPCKSSNPIADVKLTKVCVTQLTPVELVEENTRHLFFSIDVVPTHSSEHDAVDLDMSNVDSHPNGTLLGRLNASKLLSAEHTDSGLGSLCTSSEES